MLELARRKSSTGKLYRRVKKDPYGGGATRQSLPVPRRAQPIILERRRLEHDGLICIAKNCAHNGAIQSACCTCFDAPSQIQGGDCRQPGAALRRTLLYRHDEASDLELGGVSVMLLKILRGPGPPKQIRRHTNCYGADNGAGG